MVDGQWSMVHGQWLLYLNYGTSTLHKLIYDCRLMIFEVCPNDSVCNF
jgi:hypothetical protein